MFCKFLNLSSLLGVLDSAAEIINAKIRLQYWFVKTECLKVMILQFLGGKFTHDIIIRFILLTVSSDFNLGCDTWTRAGQSCYMFYSGPLSTWQDARGRCQSIQGDLINVKSVDLQVGLLFSIFVKMLLATACSPFHQHLITFMQQQNVYKLQSSILFFPVEIIGVTVWWVEMADSGSLTLMILFNL